MDMPSELDFFSFIYKRQLIWYKRFVLKEQPPWSQDKILQKFKFINMYRELDRCTTYIINRLQKVKERRTLLLNIIFYRFFNLDQLYEDLGIEIILKMDEELSREIGEKLTQLQRNRPIFNNAYLISSGGKGKKHLNILRNLAALDVEELMNKIDLAKTPEESLSHLTTIPMVGPFLACEIWTDVTYFKWFKQGWSDNDFVNIGPGAKWGLEILYGKMKMDKLYERLEQLYRQQEEILPTIQVQLGENLSWCDIAYKEAYSHYPFLSITNVEGALCEFRKYWNLSQGKGRRRYFTAVS